MHAQAQNINSRKRRNYLFCVMHNYPFGSIMLLFMYIIPFDSSFRTLKFLAWEKQIFIPG